jgi:hypothetical protein
MSKIDDLDPCLPEINYAEPEIDREQVGCRIIKHFELLGLSPIAVRWMPDAEEGYLRAEGGRQNSEWQRRLEVAGSESGTDDVGYASSVACAALWPKAWRPFEDDARRTAAATAEDRTRHQDLPVAWTAARGALRALGYAAALKSADGQLERAICKRGFGLWAPVLEAYAAGLWLYWVLHQEVVAVARPALQTVDGVLHAPDGPAVSWSGGAQYYFWRGIRIPERLLREPDGLTAREILAEPNQGIQGVMLERFGYDRFILELGAVRVQSDAFGALYRIRRPHRAPLALVHVTNSTPEVDGVRKRYFLRVPPDVRTAREAVAWTFGMRSAEYAPTKES